MQVVLEIIEDCREVQSHYGTRNRQRRTGQQRDQLSLLCPGVNEVCKSAIKTCEAQKKFGRDHGAVQEGGPFGRMSKTCDGLHLESSVLAAPEDVARDLRTLW